VRAFSRELSRVPVYRESCAAPEPRRLKLGVALGGGFARGLVHIGVLKALEQAGIPVDFVAGTSVGSIIGACYCAGMSAAELEEVARAARFKDFARWTLSRYGFCSNDRITRFCARVLRVTTFEDLRIPLAVTATDFQTGEAVVFTKGSLVAPIRASCAYPGMFHPVEIDGHSYIDGMLAYAVPTTPLRAMGAERVLGIYLSAHWAQNRAPRHMFEVIGQCFSIAQARMCELWKKDADLVIEPDVTGFSYDCFDRAKDLIALGEASVSEIVPQLRSLLNLPDPAALIASLPAPLPEPAAQPSALA
jgi:NTE family protein